MKYFLMNRIIVLDKFCCSKYSDIQASIYAEISIARSL